MKDTLLLAILAASSILMSACTVYPVQEPYYDQPVRVAPPPSQYEYYSTSPALGFVWITGYWDWVGVRYVWISGRWEAPRLGHYWVPLRWERQGDHWRKHGGRWEPDPRARPDSRIEQRMEQRLPSRPVPSSERPMFQPHPGRGPAPEFNPGQTYEREGRRPESRSAPSSERPAFQAPAPGMAVQPTPQPQLQPAPTQERGLGKVFDRESRRPAVEGSEARPERRSEPRPERDMRPGPRRSGEPHTERDEQRPPQDGDSGSRRRGREDTE